MKALRYVNKYFVKYKYRLIAGICISILSRYLAVTVPEIVKNSINIADDYRIGILQDLSLVKETLLQNILIIIGLAMLSGFFTFLMRQTLIVMSRFIEFDLKNEIFEQYERLSLPFYKKNRTGDLMNRISEDVGKVRMYFGPAVMYTINMLVLFSVAIFKMSQIDLSLTLITLLPFPILSVSIFILSKTIHKRSTLVQEYLSKMMTFGQETFSGINVIKSFALEGHSVREFDDLVEKSKEKNIHLYKAQALFFPLMILLIGISNLIVLYVGGMKYIQGILSIGTIVEFIMYVNMLTWPVAIVGWVTSTVQQAEASQKRINEFLQQKPEIVGGAICPKNLGGNFVFDNVSLRYGDTKITALKNISFSVKAGEKIALLGKTGSGKSSLLNLMARLYDPSTGKIKLDGIDLKHMNLQGLRQGIGFVPQDAFLFSDSIENNIRFGQEEANSAELKMAATNAGIHQNILEFKNGYQTLLGERGLTVSGGQKQRISIARALIKDPEILIFDDCLSAVDTETEETILKNLNKICDGKTTFIVSHRISSIKYVDRIIVLDQGEIIQEGTHEKLIEKQGYYRDFYQQQLLEKEPESLL